MTRHEARELLYLMLHAADPGLVRPGAAGRPVAHKIGWLETSRDDVAVVFTRHGPVVVTVYAQGSIDATVYAFGRAAARAALRGASVSACECSREQRHRTGHSRQSVQRDCIWNAAHAMSTKRHTIAAKSGPGFTVSVLLAVGRVLLDVLVPERLVHGGRGGGSVLMLVIARKAAPTVAPPTLVRCRLTHPRI